MVIISNYQIAVLMFVLCMVCWGSWANTQKLAQKNWRFELFYWDLAVGLVLTALLAAFTLGTFGTDGRTFMEDLGQANTRSILNAVAGGIVWNLGNLLLVAAIAYAGLAVAFPIGGGIAWVLGIAVNFVLEVMDKGQASSNPVILWTGVAIIVAAILFSSKAYKMLSAEEQKPSTKGIVLSVLAGILIALFYGLVVSSLDNSFVTGGTGNLTPYTAIVFFSLGAFISTVIANPIFMRKPVDGPPVTMKQYFEGDFKTHLSGILGAFIWMGGMVMSFMAVGAADPAISYAMSNAAPVVAALWGLFIWKEFKNAPSGTNKYLFLMFLCYLIGLTLIVYSKAG